MKKLKLTKIIASTLIVASVLALNPIGASAEWKSDVRGWWYADGNSYYTGWNQIDGNWYYFYDSGENFGYLAQNQVINGYSVNSDGVWIHSTLPKASGAISFDEALSMAVQDAFPDNNYIKIKADNGDISYCSPDRSGINGNPVAKNQSQIRGKEINYDSKELTAITAMFDGDYSEMSTKTCYSINFPIGGKLYDGYYIEASTGKIYKWNLGHIKCLN